MSVPAAVASVKAIMKYYTSGPPMKSWSLKYLVTVEVIRSVLVTKTLGMPYEQFLAHVHRVRSIIEKYEAIPLLKLCEMYPGINVTQLEVQRLDRQLGQVVSDSEHFRFNLPQDEGSFQAEITSFRRDRRPVVLYIHGGGHIMMSVRTHRKMAAKVCDKLDVDVLSIDYRLCPENPFPAGLFDAVSAYVYLVKELGYRNDDIILSGDSAGGHLAITLMLFLKNFGSKLSQEFSTKIALPRCLIGISAWSDLTLSLESVAINSGIDYLNNPNVENAGLLSIGLLYYDGQVSYDLIQTVEGRKHIESLMHLNPYMCSTLAGDFRDCCPVLLQCGSAECLLSDNLSLYMNSVQEKGVTSAEEELQYLRSQVACITDSILNQKPCRSQKALSSVRVEIYHEQIHSFQAFDLSGDVEWSFENARAYVQGLFDGKEVQSGVYYLNHGNNRSIEQHFIDEE